MSDPTVAFAESVLRSAHREGASLGRAPQPGEPEYATWKAVTDPILEGARAWFRATKCRDLPTIARQLSLAQTRRWQAAYDPGCPVAHLAHVDQNVWYPATLTLLQAEAARVAEFRARAAEPGRAAA